MERARTLTRRAVTWKLTTRVFASTAAIVCVVIGAAFVFGSASLRRAGDQAAQRGLDQSADLVAQFLAGRERSLAGGARVFVQGPYFRTLVTERRRDDILDQSFEAAERLNANWVMITDGHGVLLAKSDEPRLVGDSLGGVPLVAGALRGGATTGFGVSHDSLIFQAVAVPVVIPGGAPVGVLVATRLVDSVFAADVKAASASDVVFYVRDTLGALRVAASTIGRDSLVLVAAQSLAGRSAAEGGERRTARIRGVEYVAQTAALTTAGGDPIGGFAVMRARDAELASINSMRRSLAIAGFLGFLLALVSAYYAARRITRPVRALSDAVRRAADGDYHTGIATQTRDQLGETEIGGLASAFDALLSDLRDKETLVATVMGAATSTRAKGSGSDAPVAGTHGRRLSFARSARRSGVMVAPGEMLADRYRIDQEIGRGGMGIVYRAMDCRLGETVAVKLLRPEVVAADPQAFEHFTEELRLARRITHRNVVRTHDLGDSDGVPFITMEYIQGASLASLIASRGALAPAAVISIGKQLLRALAVAHEQGVVHGDLKPQNVLIDARGVLKITDFGVARLVRGVVPERQRRAAQATETALVASVAGAIVGTPEYMAPEQLFGDAASVKSDIYAAGVVLHECLIGVTPFAADTPVAFIARKLDGPPQAAAARVASIHRSSSQDGDGGPKRVSELEALIIQMTRPEPAERPDSAGDLADRLAKLV